MLPVLLPLPWIFWLSQLSNGSALNKPLYLLWFSHLYTQYLQFSCKKNNNTATLTTRTWTVTTTKHQKLSWVWLFLALWNRQRIYRLCFQQTASNTGYQNTAHLGVRCEWHLTKYSKIILIDENKWNNGNGSVMMEWFLITEIMSFLEFNKSYTKTLTQNIYERIKCAIWTI